MSKKKVKQQQVKVTLIKSQIGRNRRQRQCVKGLGLRKINSSAVLIDTACVRGLIQKVNFMLKVEEVA